MNIENRIQELEKELADLKQEATCSRLPKMIPIPDRDYSVGESPVTVCQYQYFCDQTGKEMPEQPEPKRPDNPVVFVTKKDAEEYCDWLSAAGNERYYLPLEDQFEHFCGDHRKANESIAVTNQNSIAPVKTKEKNKYGLYDILGCVWEIQG